MFDFEGLKAYSSSKEGDGLVVGYRSREIGMLRVVAQNLT